MTRMVSGLKLNATIRVSKIPNSRAPDPSPGDVARHRHFSCDLPGLRILSYQSSESGKMQPDAHQIKFSQKNEKEVAREEELRDISRFVFFLPLVFRCTKRKACYASLK